MDIDIYMPDIGLDEVEVTEILVKIGEEVTVEQGLITVEGEKSAIEIPSSVFGAIKDIHIKIGDKVDTSSKIMTLIVNNTSNSLSQLSTNELKKTDSLSNNESVFDINNGIKTNQSHHATPIVRRLARKLNIDLKEIIPSGRKKRILKEDIQSYIQNNSKQIDRTDFFSEEEIMLSYLQKNVARNLSQNWMQIPHVTQFDEIDITVLEKFRQKYNIEQKNNITILVFIIKVLSYALENFPIVNSSFSKDKNKIVLHKEINIGIAVDVKNDLLVPVLKNVNKKNIVKLSSELTHISNKARQGQLTQEDKAGGSFTISSLGGIGGGWFTPIINAPEVAILGVSKATIKPLWNNKEFVPSLMLPISLSYDHRVMNGAYAARFIAFIGKVLSDMHFIVM